MDIFTIISVVMNLLLIFILVGTAIKRIKPKAPMMMGPPTNLSDLLNDLNMLVDLETIGVVDIPSAVKEQNIITNFNEVRDEIVKNILSNLSTQFFQKANSAGVKRQYIIVYVTRKTNAKLIEYMGKNNLSMK